MIQKIDPDSASEIRNALFVIQCNTDLMNRKTKYDEKACRAVQVGVVRIIDIINVLEGIGRPI